MITCNAIIDPRVLGGYGDHFEPESLINLTGIRIMLMMVPLRLTTTRLNEK
jgi:hypothetical protein